MPEPEAPTASPEPDAAELEPLAAGPEFGAAEPRPAGPELVAAGPEPVTAEPVTAEPESVAARPEPDAAGPEPASAEPEATIREPEPAIDEPELATAEPETTDAELEQAAAELGETAVQAEQEATEPAPEQEHGSEPETTAEEPVAEEIAAGEIASGEVLPAETAELEQVTAEADGADTTPDPQPANDEPEEIDLLIDPDTEPVPVQPAAANAEAITQPIAVRDTRETVLIAVPERTRDTEPDERPFWMPVQEMPRGSRRPPIRRRPGRPPKPPRRPAAGLIALLVLALVATFFAWVSAEPLWLAVGHGNTGTATVTECTGDGVSQRCLGEFTAAGGAFTAERVRLLGVGDKGGEGTTVAAKMVGSDSGRAYVDAASTVLHLRWGLGMALVALCGVGIVWATGAMRLEDSRSRRRATLAGLAAPLLVAIAFLAATF